jgi:hypothetical protein
MVVVVVELVMMVVPFHCSGDNITSSMAISLDQLEPLMPTNEIVIASPS